MNLRHASFVLPLALATLAAHAQQQPSTWHGLRFGETRDRVRSQLSAQMLETAQSQDGSLEATQDYALFLPGLRYELPLQPSFHFTEAGTLMDVTLTVDAQAMRRVWSNALPGEDLERFAADHLGGALAGRYGTPLYRSPGCDAAASKTEPEHCVVFWNGPEESILLERRGGHVFVRYQMLATDL